MTRRASYLLPALLLAVALALTFNGVGVLAAISGLVAPVWAMIAMAASVSLVLANSFAGKLLSRSGRAGVQKA